jgi:hypothetical protein
VETAERVRQTLASAGCDWRAAELGGLPSDRVTDIDIGVVALESLEVLVAAGVSFIWADQQPPENRSEDLYGVPVMK